MYGTISNLNFFIFHQFHLFIAALTTSLLSIYPVYTCTTIHNNTISIQKQQMKQKTTFTQQKPEEQKNGNENKTAPTTT